MKVINLAHGELVLLAAYIAYTLESAYGLNPVLAIPLAVAAVVVAAVAGVLAVSAASAQDRELNSLILTFGIGVDPDQRRSCWSGRPISARPTSTWFMQEAVVIGERSTACQRTRSCSSSAASG